MLASPVAGSAISEGSLIDAVERSTAHEDVYTMEEAARRKGVSYHTVSRAVRSGKLRATRRGRMALIDGEDLHRWTPMRQRAPKRYRKPPDPEAVPGVVDLASGERVELARRLAVFSQTIHLAAAERDQQTFHQRLCDRFSQAIGLRRAVLWTVDEERDVATRAASYGPEISQAPASFSPIPSGLLDYVNDHPAPHLDQDFAGVVEPAGFQLDHVRSMLITPLCVGDRLLGVLLGDWDGEVHSMDEDVLSLTQILANQAALAVDLARLRTAERDRTNLITAILENLSEAVSATDGNHHMLYMNKASREITGYENPETTVNRPVLEVAAMVKRYELDGSELLPADTPLAVALAGERVRDRRYVIERPDGVQVTVSVNAEPIRDGDAITGAVAVTRDITDSLEQQDAEREQRRNLESAVERARAVGDISLAVNSGDDLQSVLTTAISKMTDRLGGVSGSIYFHHANKEQFGGQMIGQVGYRLNGSPVQGSPEALMQLPATLVALAKLTANVQTYAKASTAERAVFDRYGFRSALIVPLIVRSEPIGVVYVNYMEEDREISDEDLGFASALASQCALAIEKARLHDELAAAHQRLVAVLDQLPYGIILSEAPDHQITFANAVARSLLDYPKSGAHKTVSELPMTTVKPGLFGSFDRQLEATLRGEQSIQGQAVRVTRPNGDEVPAVAHVSVLRDSSGRQSGAICLLETGADADQTDRLTSDIVAAIAHELRNPLTALIGNLQLLRRRIGEVDEIEQDYLDERLDRLEVISKQLAEALKSRE